MAFRKAVCVTVVQGTLLLRVWAPMDVPAPGPEALCKCPAQSVWSPFALQGGVLHLDSPAGILHQEEVLGQSRRCSENSYDSTNCKPNLSIQVQASSMLRTTGKQDHILFQLERMQLQKGGLDCDLFAIANVTDLCNGNNPANYR